MPYQYFRILHDTEFFHDDYLAVSFQCKTDGHNEDCLPQGFESVPLDLVNCRSSK